ncbi:hypothetical protein RF11_02420 [Thelohanellus kitauei]|uniref:Uncharacterized protein n=1 Tax=Thelohanellus kitauei TaxID=669202 RepID=A0A0C2MI97_THEKT|nr:hypothetical protein RF11_02420 [Thelohanellus kitauei]
MAKSHIKRIALTGVQEAYDNKDPDKITHGGKSIRTPFPLNFLQTTVDKSTHSLSHCPLAKQCLLHSGADQSERSGLKTFQPNATNMVLGTGVSTHLQRVPYRFTFERPVFSSALISCEIGSSGSFFSKFYMRFSHLEQNVNRGYPKLVNISKNTEYFSKLIRNLIKAQRENTEALIWGQGEEMLAVMCDLANMVSKLSSTAAFEPFNSWKMFPCYLPGFDTDLSYHEITKLLSDFNDKKVRFIHARIDFSRCLLKLDQSYKERVAELRFQKENCKCSLIDNNIRDAITNRTFDQVMSIAESMVLTSKTMQAINRADEAFSIKDSRKGKTMKN